MKLPYELAVLPDEAVVQWGWVRRKLEADEPDEEERMMRLVGELVTRNFPRGGPGVRCPLFSDVACCTTLNAVTLGSPWSTSRLGLLERLVGIPEH